MAEVEIEKKYFIYVLELQQNKYYVGKTSNAASRMAEHIRNLGAKWTKKYRPKKIIKLYKNCDAFDEDKYTVMYMAIYGIDNVRGGSFCKTNLSHADRIVLEKMIVSASDRCFKCGSTDHFAKDCDVKENEPVVDLLVKWCSEIAKNNSNGEISRYVLIDAVGEKTYEFCGEECEELDILEAKKKFVSKLSRKYRATLFNLSVTPLDFCIKMLETETPPYLIIHKEEEVAVLCRYSDTEVLSDKMAESVQKELERSIRTMLDTGEFTNGEKY